MISSQMRFLNGELLADGEFVVIPFTTAPIFNERSRIQQGCPANMAKLGFMSLSQKPAFPRVPGCFRSHLA